MADPNAVAGAPPRRRVQVGLGARSYDVWVGPGVLAEAGEHAAALTAHGKTLIVTDETVAKLHLDGLTDSLAAAGVANETITIPVGEASKSWSHLETVCETMLASGVERDDIVIALGGGVVGDLAGFAAAIINRGVNLVQIPTTLLAQVDSSVGGKTAINTRSGKNLVGAFHQPRLVLADTDVLSTLSDADLRAGFAEIIKIAAMRDADIFTWLEAHGEAVLARSPAALTQAITQAIQLKADIVAADEREAGVRALLNFGHTFGHAFEAEAAYAAGLAHGFAVAAGMALAAAFAVEQGVCAPDVCTRITSLIARSGLPTHAHELAGAPFNAERILTRMQHDKKVAEGRVRLILPERIGAGRIVPLPSNTDLAAFLADRLEAPAPTTT